VPFPLLISPLTKGGDKREAFVFSVRKVSTFLKTSCHPPS